MTASRGLNEAPPPRAPNPMALPAAINAGTRAAKGRRPPFCLFDVLLLVPLHLFFLLFFFEPWCLLVGYEYTGIMTMVDALFLYVKGLFTI